MLTPARRQDLPLDAIQKKKLKKTSSLSPPLCL